MNMSLQKIEDEIKRHLTERRDHRAGHSSPAPIDRTLDLRRCGLIDSLSLVDFVLFLESSFGCRIPARLWSGGRVLSIESAARLVCESRAQRVVAENARTDGGELRIAHAGSCTLQETLAVGGRAGGYRGFLWLVRDMLGPDVRLSVAGHPRLRWDEIASSDIDGILARADVPSAWRQMLEDRRFDPARFADADVILLDVVHESYLWRVKWGRGQDLESADGAGILLGGTDDATRRWLNVNARPEPPIGMNELERAMGAGIECIRRNSTAPIVVVIGLWHRPRTCFTTSYTGSSFDSALRRYLLSTQVTSPDAFFARLQGIDSVARRVAERHGITIVDGRKELAEAGQAAFADPIHLNDLGWDLLGRALLRGMQAAGVIDRSATLSAAPADSPYRSIGARASLAVDQLKSADLHSYAVQDVFALPVQVLRLSDQLNERVKEIAGQIAALGGGRIMLWGLGAIGARLAQHAVQCGIEAVEIDGPFLDEWESVAIEADFIVAGIREGEFGREWARQQLRCDMGTVNFLEISDVPATFAPGVEGTADVRNRHASAVEALRHIDRARPGDRTIILFGDPAISRRVQRLAGRIAAEVLVIGSDERAWSARVPAGAVVLLCGADADGAMELQSQVRGDLGDGCEVVNPDIAWLRGAAAPSHSGEGRKDEWSTRSVRLAAAGVT